MQSSYNNCSSYSFLPARNWQPLSVPVTGICFPKRSSTKNYAEIQQQISLATTKTNLPPVKNRHEINNKENLKEYVSQLHHNALDIDPEVYVHLLKCCGELKELSVGQHVHGHIVACGLGEETFLSNLLIQMYDKCNALQQARAVFDQMPDKTVFSWNSIISAYANHNHGREAIMLFNQMQDIGQAPNEVTIITALNACANEGTLFEGRLLHSFSVAYGLEPDLFVGTAIVKMYSRCKCLEDSERAFNKLHECDVVAWNSMIGIYTKQGFPQNALNTYKQMQKKNISPDYITFLLLLESCGKLADISEGRFIHVCLLEAGVDGSTSVGNALISMYSKCGNLEDAQIEFNKMHVHDVVSWNTIMSTYTQHGLGQNAITLYREMTSLGFEPNDFTFSTVISACSDAAALDEGSRIHATIVDQGLEYDVVVATALIDMYKNCNSLENARTVFSKVRPYTVEAGTAMIGTYTEHGKGNEALELYKQMLQDGLEPDAITFANALGAVASLADINEGKLIHKQIKKLGFESDVLVGAALINMYGKCGSLENSQMVFDNMKVHDSVSWNALLTAYAQYGLCDKVNQIITEMQEKGFPPNVITFVSALSAFSRSGHVDLGVNLFNSMQDVHGITPTIEHYGCLVDLYARAGHLKEAEDVINEMPVKPNALIWETLLTACRNFGDVERGKRAAEKAASLNKQSDSPYAVLSNMYAAEGRWEEVVKLQKKMLEIGVRQKKKQCIAQAC